MSIDHAQQLAQARSAAMRTLGRRGLSRVELSDHLVRRGFDAAVARGTVERLAAEGYLDDRAYAEDLCRGILRRQPAAPDRVVQRLIGRGIERELAVEVVEAAMGGVELLETAVAWAERHLAARGPLDPTRSARRVAGLLARRGFDEDLIGLVLERLDLAEDADHA
jgi:regulatory protein